MDARGEAGALPSGDAQARVTSADPIVEQFFRGPEVYGVHLIVDAWFRSLPAGQHTYMLTLGSGWTKNALSVTVGDHGFDSDALAANPATSDVRLLFVYEPQGEDHLRVHVSADLSKRSGSHVPFHHLQLVQID